jgi:hypothetical protein
MEGASGKIVDTENANVVMKILHTHRSKTKSLTAREQAKMQRWAETLTRDFAHLFVPEVIEVFDKKYSMKRVDVSKPLYMLEIQTHPVFPEIQKFFQLCRKEGIYPADFELYEQKDGRVALLDFDKFATWKKDGSIVFSWGQTLSAEEVNVNLRILGI